MGDLSWFSIFDIIELENVDCVFVFPCSICEAFICNWWTIVRGDNTNHIQYGHIPPTLLASHHLTQGKVVFRFTFVLSYGIISYHPPPHAHPTILNL